VPSRSFVLIRLNIEIKLITAAIYSSYETSIIDDEGIDQLNGFIGRPAGNKLILRFKRVQDSE
jgi:hypothetical protein